MNINEATAFLRSDEDDPDYLRDKPMGWCPWCEHILLTMKYDGPDGTEKTYSGCLCPRYDDTETELENRARYQEERMAASKIEERVNRELSRRKE